MGWRETYEAREAAADAVLDATAKKDPGLIEFWKTATPEQKFEIRQRAMDKVNEREEFRSLVIMEERPILRNMMQNPFMTDDQKQSVLDDWWEDVPSAEEADTKLNRLVQNAKDSFFGIDSVGTTAGAAVDDFRRSLSSGPAGRYKGLVSLYRNTYEENQRDALLPVLKEALKDDENWATINNNDPLFMQFNRDDRAETLVRQATGSAILPAVRAQALEKIRSVTEIPEVEAPPTEKVGEAATAFYSDLVRRDAKFAGLPEWEGLIEGTTALTGQLVGAIPTPENIGGATASNVGGSFLKRMLARGAIAGLENAGLNLATEPIVQAEAIQKGVQDDVDIAGGATRLALGIGLGLGGGAFGEVRATARELTDSVGVTLHKNALRDAEANLARAADTGRAPEVDPAAERGDAGSTPAASSKEELPATKAQGEQPTITQNDLVEVDPRNPSIDDPKVREAVEAEPNPPPAEEVIKRGTRIVERTPPEQAKPRRFGERVSKDERLSDGNRVRENYTVTTDKEQVANADRYIEEKGSLANAAIEFISGRAPEDFSVILSHRLVDRFLAEGNEDMAVNVVLAASRYGTTTARLLRQYSLWNRLTPSGALKAAVKTVDAVNETLSPETMRVKREVERILGQPLSPEKLNQLLDELRPPEAVIWPQYRSAMARALLRQLLPNSPKDKASLQILSDRLQTILQRRLDSGDPKVKAPNRDVELNRITGLLNNPGRIEGVLDELVSSVQASKKHTAAQKEAALGLLRDADFRQPNSEELSRLVSEQIKQDKIDLSEMINGPAAREDQFWATYPEELAARLGLSGEQAKRMSGRIRKQLENALADQRGSELSALAGRLKDEGAPRKVLSRLDKLTRLDRLGALDAMQFNDLIDKALGLEGLSSKQRTEIMEQARKANDAPEGDRQLYEAAKLEMLIDELKPRTFAQKLRTARILSMLLNMKTIIRNLGGNAILSGVEMMQDVLSATLDAGWTSASRLFVDPETKRVKSLPSMKAYGQGLLVPFQEARDAYRLALNDRTRTIGRTSLSRSTTVNRHIDALQAGLDYVATLSRLSAANKFDMGSVRGLAGYTFSSRVGRGLEKTLTTVLGVPDRAFWWGAYKKSLADQMRAAQVTAPNAQMVARAEVDAMRAIFQDDNVMSRALAKGRTALNSFGFGFDKKMEQNQFGLGDVLIPFTHVPGSILMRAVEYSPAGMIRTIYDLVPAMFGTRAFDRRQALEDASRMIIGSAGIGGGFWMAGTGLLTDAPEQDPDIESMRRELGVGGYRINWSAFKEKMITGDWNSYREFQPGDLVTSYDWAQPLATTAAMGVELHANLKKETEKRGVFDFAHRLGFAVTSGSKTLYEQPLFQGISGFFERSGYSDPLTAFVDAMTKDLPASLVPTQVNQLQQIRDNRVFETRGSRGLEATYAKVASRIPGLAEVSGFPPSRNQWGDLNERYPNAGNSVWNVMMNPAFVNRVKNDPVGLEILRVWRETGEAGVIPTRVKPKLKINGVDRELTNEEITDMQQWVGRLTRDFQEQLIQSPLYMRMNEGGKAKMLGEIVTDASSAYKVLFLGDKKANLGRFARLMIGAAQGDESVPQASAEQKSAMRQMLQQQQALRQIPPFARMFMPEGEE